MDYMLRKMGVNAPMGEGRVYNNFAPRIQNAYDKMFVEVKDCKKQMDDKAQELFGMSYAKLQAKAESTKVWRMKYMSPQTTTAKKGESRNEEMAMVSKDLEIYVTEAMYILATWAQADGRKTLIKQGFTEQNIQELRDALDKNNPKWNKFIDWVVQDFLPSRRGNYNNVHKQLFGISMAKVPNYFPIKRSKRHIQEETDIANVHEAPLASTVVGSIIERTNNTTPIDVNTSFFEALNENMTTMEAWAVMAPIIQDINTMLSSKAVTTAMNDIYDNFTRDFEKAAQVATLQYVGEKGKVDKAVMTILGKMWASSKIAFRLYTAFKQLSSCVLFLGYSADPKFAAYLVKRYACGFANAPVTAIQKAIQSSSGIVDYTNGKNIDVWGNIEWCRQNLPSFAKRWEVGFAGYDVMTKTVGKGTWKGRTWSSKVDEMVDAVGRFGFKPNAFVDAFTSAAGARAVYDYEMDRLKAEGYSEEEAKAMAIYKAEHAFNTTQQSAEGLYLSPMQRDGGIVSTALSTFMNAGFAMYRNQMIAGRELLKTGDKLRYERGFLRQQEEKRYRNMVSKRLDEYYQSRIEQGLMTKEEADKLKAVAVNDAVAQAKDMIDTRVKKKLSDVKAKAALMFMVNGWLGTWAFNMMAKLPALIWGVDDDDEEQPLWKQFLDIAIGLPAQNIPIAKQLSDMFLNGRDVSFFGSMDDLNSDWGMLRKEFEKNGLSLEAAEMTMDIITLYALGVDLDSMINIYKGVENMFEDGITRENVLLLANAPTKQVSLLAGERREGETIKQYTNRVMALYSYLDSPTYNEYYVAETGSPRKGDESPRGMTKKQMVDFENSYEKQYRLDVVKRMDGEKAAERVKQIDNEYAKLVEELRISRKLYNDYGEYVNKVDGLSFEEAMTLQGIYNEIKSNNGINAYLIQNDDNAYQYVMGMTMMKEQFINKYNEFK
jgi:hypothetical protein